MTSCNASIRRLETLRDKCGGLPGVNKKEQEVSTVDTSKMSPYEQKQYKIACDMKRVRDNVEEMENLPKSAPVDQRARLGNQIRRDVLAMSNETKMLRVVAMKEGKKEEFEQLLKHVNRTERLSRGNNNFHNSITSDEFQTINGFNNRAVRKLIDEEMGRPGGSEGGASVRDDPEFAQFFEETKKNDQEIDLAFDRIGARVKVIHQKATAIREELSLQENLLGEIETKIDTTHSKMRGLNKKLKETLASVDKDRICLYIFCCLLLLGIVGACVYIFVYRKN
eukprot:Tbor_TRINITY_DN2723_c0_g1::TRINITY_DN2723_c0_g1_i1::g.15202::m.15202